MAVSLRGASPRAPRAVGLAVLETETKTTSVARAWPFPFEHRGSAAALYSVLTAKLGNCQAI